MLLRRITKHVKDQNWFAVGIDFVIVVIGVFIGIQVANWNDAQIETRAERVLQHNIQSDMIVLEGEFDSIIERYDETLNSTGELLDLLRSGEEPDDSLRVKYLIWRAGYYHEFPAFPPSYTELLSSGHLGQLSSPELRRALIRFGDQYNRFERNAQVAKSAILDPTSAHAAAAQFSAAPAKWTSDGSAVESYDWQKLVDAKHELQIWQAYQFEAYTLAKSIRDSIDDILSSLDTQK